MTRLAVLRPGLLTTVQDLGREGLGALGVPRGGAIDREALAFANVLVGNPPGAAGLEIWYQGPVLRAEEDDVILAVAGAPFGPAPGRPIRLAAGDEIDLSPAQGAGRAVVAVGGGLQVPAVLGSLSTSVAAGFGGVDGRRLVRGDVLKVGSARTPRGTVPLPPDLLGHDGAEVVVRLAPGAHAEEFEDRQRRALVEAAWEVLPASNRAGFRLRGPSLAREVHRELPSQGALTGAVQVTRDGAPIVLLHEGPPTGGYPQIGSVAEADLGLMVRVRTGQRIRFRGVSWREARAALAESEERLTRWTETVRGRST